MKILNIVLFFILLVTVSQSVKSETYSMRDCMLLPITDTAGNSFGFKIYEELERKIKNDGWCNYRPSSEVIGIFSKYREKLSDYLNDENVLKTVADRLKVGTLIRVNLTYEVDKISVELTIIGENGSDIYLQEKTIVNDINTTIVLTTITNWLNVYEASLPYHGKVLGVLGDQVTFSYPKSKNIKIGQEFTVKRLINKKQHPLLKKIVEWDSVMLAKGKIFNTSRGQALGSIKVYTTKKRVNVGDWIRLEKSNEKSPFSNRKFKNYQKNKFGKLGDLSLSFVMSNHTVSTTPATGNLKVGGFIYGVSAEAEAWITRNYFVMGEFTKKVGDLTKQSGTPVSKTSGQNSGVIKIGGGYKYLPLGFFYGPQVNLYSGWVKYSYQMDSSPRDAFGTNSISGFFLGLGGSIPLKKQLRIFGKGEILPFGEFVDEDNIFGTKKSISSMNLNVGIHYYWSPLIKLLASFEVINNTGKFSGYNSEISYRDTAVKLGGVFTF